MKEELFETSRQFVGGSMLKFYAPCIKMRVSIHFNYIFTPIILNLSRVMKKQQHFSTYLKAFFVPHSSEHETCRTRNAFKYVEKCCPFFVLRLSSVVPSDYLHIKFNYIH